jgi:signal transduction histidine kinase
MSSVHPHRKRFSNGLVVSALAATVLVASMIAYEAVTASRAHRVAAENTLRDYASLAAWQFARASRSDIESAAASVFMHFSRRGVTAPTDASELPDPHRYNTIVAEQCEEGCPRFTPVRHFFAMGLGDHAPIVQEEFAPPGFAEWLQDSIRTHIDLAAVSSWMYGLIPRQAGTDRSVIVYMVARVCDTGEPRAVYGFEVDAGSLAAIFDRVTHQRPLLPPSLLRGASSDSLLTVTVRSGTGELLYAHLPHGAPDFTAQDTLSPSYGGFLVEAGLQKATASSLIIGGLPKSRVPFLAGLLLIAGGLVGFAVHLMYRQSELVRIRSDFVAGVSHELRTPVAQIRMFAETLLLNRVRSPAERRRSLEVIDQEARRLTHLVENVLLFSKSGRRDEMLSMREHALSPLLRNAMAACQPLAAARGVRLATAFTADPSARVDETVLRQIVLNLLDNALKYGPPGQQVVVSLDEREGQALIAVEDQGPGISPRDRERIWEPYVRLAPSAPVAGSGIGLSVVRQFVEMQGGRVRVEEGAVGARFVVELPAVTPFAGGDGHATPATAEPAAVTLHSRR